MNSESITTCPICENENFELYLTTKDYTVTYEEFNLQKCKRCSFLITSPRPTATSIGKYYASEKYISHSGTSKTLIDRIYLKARSLTLKWKYQIISEYTNTTGNILDFGCGTGEFLEFVKNKGLNVIGVEPNEMARRKANAKIDGKVSESLSAIKTNSVDIITLWHVLEHVHDLNNTIQNLKHLLTPTGHIIIAVPNPKSADCQKYKTYWAAYDVPRHLWHFTQDTMQLLLHRNGLKLVDLKPMKLDSFYVSLLSEGYKNPSQPKLLTAVKAFSEGLRSNQIAKRSNDYSSLIYIARPE